MSRFTPIFFLLMLAGHLSACAQNVDFQQHPPDVVWHVLESGPAQLIFPGELHQDAQRIANTLAFLFEADAVTLGVRPKPISIVLAARGTRSNGFVALAPRRSEWEHLPPFPAFSDFVGGTDWYDLLAIHEYRHVVQYDKLNSGFTRIAGIAGGETARAGLSMMAAPSWFWEGDAVGLETALTNGGRGRIPQFLMHYKAAAFAGKRPSYGIAHHGSYQTYIPSQYPLGYLLTTHVRHKNGVKAWSDVLDRSSRVSFLPFAFNWSLKRTTGSGVRGTYQTAMDQIESFWKASNDQYEDAEVTFRSDTPDRWTNYLFPKVTENGSVIAIKFGLNDPPSLIEIGPGGDEKSLALIDPDVLSFGFDYHKDFIVWSRSVPDARWGRAARMETVVKNLKDGQSTTLPGTESLFIPHFSPDGSQIAAVSFNSSRTTDLVVLDAESGSEQTRISSPENRFISGIAWHPKGLSIAMIRHTLRGKTIEMLDIESGELRTILPETQENIIQPAFSGDHLLYSSPYSGTDNIYAINITTGRRFLITSRLVGAFHPYPDESGETLFFNDYQHEGYRIARMPLDSTRWLPIEDVAVRRDTTFQILLDQEQGAYFDLTAAIPDSLYATRPLTFRDDLPRFHSWLPILDDREIGIYAEARNLLNTAGLAVGGIFDRNESVIRGLGSATYAGWFPVLDISADHGMRATDYSTVEGQTFTDVWNETNLSAGVTIPLNYSRGVVRRSVLARVRAGWTGISGKEVTRVNNNGNGNLAFLSGSFVYRRSTPSAPSDFISRSSLAARLQVRGTPFGGDYRGTQAAGDVAMTTRGFGPHHAVTLTASAEYQTPDGYRFSSIFTPSRGYSHTFQEFLSKTTASYSAPLFYPDRAISTLLYLKRIRATAFTDIGLGILENQNSWFNSAGFELRADVRLFDIPSEVTLGTRMSYRFRYGDVRFEPVIQLGF